MAFAENLSQFFDPDGFAIPVVLKDKAGATLRTINVILETPEQNVAVFGADIETVVPTALCQTSDLTGVQRGYTITNGATVYVILASPDDGTGLTTLRLKKQ